MAKISERALMQEMPEHEQPLSEQFRVVAKEWVDANKAARLLEEMKTATLARMKQDLILRSDKLSDAAADRIARASPEWTEYIHQMVDAESAANLARVKMKWVELRHSEWMSEDANARRERHMGRQTP